MSHHKQHEDCCPQFDPETWDNQLHQWKDKLFIKDTIPQFLHFPWPATVRKTINRLWKQAQDAGAATELKDFLLMAHDASPWKSEFYMLVTRKVPHADNVKLSGTYFSKVFDGSFNKVPQYIREMDIYLTGQDKLAKKYYFYFTTYSKCARKYGHNYIVAIAEL
jgi:hypothetical protein